MLLSLSNTKHLNTLVHEGKMLIIATVKNGSTYELYYTVKQDGFEDSALQPDSNGWEKFQKLDLPAEKVVDASVEKYEADNLTDKDKNYLLRSRYDSAGLSADAPVQMVSHDGFIYIFRQSTAKTLLLDRFVLDGMTNTLNRKLEVRFKRSKQRYAPQKPAKISGNGQMNAADSLDFRDIDNKPFYEPSTEILPGILNNLQNGNFAVVVTPTEEKEVYRWHLFVALSDKVTLISLRSGDEQVFDVNDHWFREVDGDTDQATYNSIPGIIKREFSLQKAIVNTSLVITQGLSAVKYDVQRSANTSAGNVLIRDTSKILLAMPTDQGIATLNFSIALNGTLAEIALPANVTALRQQQREILLPLTILDNIKAIGATKEPPGGTITRMQRSNEDTGADCVQIQTNGTLAKLAVGNTVTLKDTNSYDGLYTIENVGDGTFSIKADFNYDEMGSWEKVEEETGLVFDGMLTGYNRNDDGTLTVNAVNHGLQKGDQVQIVGSPDYDGEYPVVAKDDKHFTIQRLWAKGEAVNITAQSRKRRGLVFDGGRDCVSVPFSDPVKCSGGFTLETWVKPKSDDTQMILHLEGGNLLVDKDADKGLRDSLKNKSKEEITRLLLASKPEEIGWVLCENQGGVYFGYNRYYQKLLAPYQLSDEEALQYLEDYPHVKTYLTNSSKMPLNAVSAKWHYGNYGRIDGLAIKTNGQLLASSISGSSEWTHLAAVYDQDAGYADFHNGGIQLPVMNPDYTQGFTFEAWVKMDELVENARIFDFGGGNDANNIFLTTVHVSSRKQFVFCVYPQSGGRSEVWSGEQQIDNGKWIHIAVIVTANGKGYIYKNGVEIGTNESGMILPPTTDRTTNFIGKSSRGNQDYITGKIRDVRIWNKARSQDEIKARMYTNLTGTEDGLVANWMLETSKNSTTPDRTGKYTGTLVGNVTIEKKACIKLFTNGKISGIDWVAPLKFNANALVIAAQASKTTSEGVISNTSQYLRGEMSEVRLWNCARSADEIADTMHLQLTGRETGLAGYWKLGGVAEEDGHKLIYDFSVNANHGEAQGAPYAGGFTLNGKLRDGITDAVKYCNDELFAVVEGAMYEEHFEFKMSNVTADPNNIDGQQGKVFVPDLWGRLSRASEEKISVAPMTSAFGSPVDDWRTFTCTFMIPEGVRLLRCFGIADVKGGLSNIEIRRHSIKLMSDTVRLSSVTESVSLSELVLAPANARATLTDIRTKEMQEATWVTRLKWLEAELRKLQEQKERLDKNDQEALEKLQKEQNEMVATAKSVFDAADADYQSELNNWINYWERIQVYHSGLYLDGGSPVEASHLQRLVQRSANASDNQLWQRIGTDSGYFKIVCKANQKIVACFGAWKNEGNPVGLEDNNNRGDYHLQWSVIEPRSYDQKDYYSIRPRHSDKVLDVLNGSTGDGEQVVQGNSRPDNKNQKFCFLKSDVATVDGKVRIDAAKQLRDEKETNYQNEKAKTVMLSLTSGDVTAKINKYRAEKTAINASLTTLRTGIATAQGTYLATATNSANTALTMPDVPDQHSRDANYPGELKVQASLLIGSIPATRVQAMESCAGVVALNYQDELGCLRQAQYDTTYDTDGKGEQWRTEPLSVALKRAGTNLTIPTSVFENISQQITIEFWAKGGSDLPVGWELITDNESAFTLAELATVRYGLESTWEVRELSAGYYSSLNTVFGDPVPGRKKRCEILSHSFLTAKSNDGHKVLKIQIPNANEEIVWQAGNQDSIRQRSTVALYRENWTHWAFVKDCDKGEMKVYANGRLYCSNKVDIQDSKTKLTQSLGGITSVVFDASWQGAIAELRIWNEALGEREIEMNSLLAPSGNEPGLVAYYRMDEAKGDIARDQTGKHAALNGVAGQWIPCTLPLNQSGVMTFDGAINHLQLPTMTPNFSKGITVEAWVNYSSSKHWSHIIDIGEQEGLEANIKLANIEQSTRLRWQVGSNFIDTNNPIGNIGEWVHVAATIGADGKARIYRNGSEVGAGNIPLPPADREFVDNYIGKSNWSANLYFNGQMRDVRLWKCARTQDEIIADMNTHLSGQEINLVGNWLSPSVPRLAPVLGSEYSRMRVNANGQKSAMMMRTVAMPSPVGVVLFDEQRIEELELKWIGNAQIKPTLLGYIEGAPPVPSENLTIEDDYNGATSVELIQSSEVTYSWTREQDVSGGMEAELLVGVESETLAGLGVMTSVEEMKSGLGAKTNFAYHKQNASNVGVSHSIVNTDRLELRGSKETDPNFPYLGNRFIPKNVGYALVLSGMADVFVSKLKRSGRMVGYQVLPTKEVPLDTNTITFLINPAYTMAGSLDGLTGSAATSKRFFSHVPDMRNQYGALYPASYLRLKDAYDLKKYIDYQDKQHEAYFYHYSLRVEQQGVGANVDSDSVDESPEVQKLKNAIGEQKNIIDELDKKSDKTEPEKTKLSNAQSEKNKLENDLNTQKETEQNKRKKENQDRVDKIKNRFSNQNDQIQAEDSFDFWQRKMEELQTKSGKRNIVNSYVWDADGGFHAEEQQFASTVEHSIAGSFEFGFAVGGQLHISLAKALVELSAYATVNLTQTISKTEGSSNALELHVDLSGVESRGITDYKDRPLLPGEKVDRYRFMTFYLEKNTNHWHDFFNQVVDPEWLASNDEEARALRQTQLAAPNEVWRVLHRVTYVERPALMGFGRDMRALSVRSEEDDTITTLRELKLANKTLEAKLDTILAMLARK